MRDVFRGPNMTEAAARTGDQSERASRARPRARWLVVPLAVSLLVGASCFESEQGETFYGRVAPPAAREFRWSDGGLPRVFDPALAAAPPDTDAVRALFEGLTDYDPVSLEPVAAVATRWESSADQREWTFHLRRDARWSNGDAVTAKDFVRSWRRTLQLGERAPHARLLENIRGAHVIAAAQTNQPTADAPANAPTPTPTSPGTTTQTPAPSRTSPAAATPNPSPSASSSTASGAATPAATPLASEAFGAEAVGEHVLRVRLKRPDRHFPALVAHPVFRPVHETGGEAAAEQKGEGEAEKGEGESAAARVVSNGAFRLSWSAADGVLLERASHYWDAGAVALERVRFVPARNAEEALTAYRRGEVDAVTNAAFAPLALKLLAPYKDFRRATYGALTYYTFNLSRPPFNDRRVREALAVALDRERLSADAMNGATEPARKFLPEQVSKTAARGDETSDENSSGVPSDRPVDDGGRDANQTAGSPPAETQGGEAPDGSAAGEARADAAPSQPSPSTEAPTGEGGVRNAGAADSASAEAAPLEESAERARRLLAEAGYPGGAGFPRVRLLVNRNEQQRRMAQAVAQMWRERLGVETEIVMRAWDEYEAAYWSGDYDVARRSVVMQTTDEESNMLAMFDRATLQAESHTSDESPAATPATDAANANARAQGNAAPAAPAPPPVLTEVQALRELPAFPLYFASSYALVKPYVSGFDANLLDAPSLKHVRVDPNWKPPPREGIIRVVSNR